ncbi:hypothetical protein Pan97_24810 [Bremerella volcania]|uniref:Thioredoxin-like fold domain-containing protein n=1 Tax=Bremerella volcania TaxID=2527984 RepID=A0A518C8A0_9BACT|nr:thioredoxin family protein [Bremerella volcania]QDU75449.1 hypothetical protein Pan97_24810 [Bremerella volcania]
MHRIAFNTLLLTCILSGSTWLCVNRTDANRPIPLPETNAPVSIPAKRQPIIYFFTRSDCVYCRPMRQLANQLHREGHTVYVVDESRQDLVRQYGVTAYPTFLVVNDRTIVRRVIGLTTKERVLGQR